MDLHKAELTRIVLSTPWLVQVLRTVQHAGPPQSYVAAGAIRNTVWNSLHGRPRAKPIADVDVVYFENTVKNTVKNTVEKVDWSHRLQVEEAAYDWDVTNQATVHRWQSEYYDRTIPPYRSLEAALETWPETATAVAVRLDHAGGVEVVAPFGLEDLFQLKVRPSPEILDATAFQVRLREKKWQSRWPKLVVVTGLMLG